MEAEVAVKIQEEERRSAQLLIEKMYRADKR